MLGIRTVSEKEGEGYGLSQKPQLTTSIDIPSATPSRKEAWAMFYLFIFFKLGTFLKVLEEEENIN